MTYEEREAAKTAKRQAAVAERERVVAEQRTKQVEAFKERNARDRAKRVFSQKAALEVGELEPAQRTTVYCLLELVGDYDRTEEQLRNLFARVTERVADATKRLDAGERPNWYSSLLGTDPVEIEQIAGRRQALAEGIFRLGLSTGWHVPQVMSVRERELFDLRTSLHVTEIAGGWGVYRNVDVGWMWLHYVDDRPVFSGTAAPALLHTEEAAWIAAMRTVGEQIY